MKSIICSASDSKYWPLLSGMLNSVEKPAKQDGFSFGILDVGLTQEQKSRLDLFGAVTVSPEWDYKMDHLAEQPPSHLRAMAARPHLPKYFPGYDLYIWLDADCWVQDWSAVVLLAQCALSNKFAIVPEIDRSYTPFFSRGPVFEWLLE